MQGIVYEIQKFALHDGPGIRSVIFLKGCPLTCLWCSNPESQFAKPQLGYDQEKCTNCNACIDACTRGVFTAHRKNLQVNHKLCNACGKCLNECVHDALKTYGYQTDAEKMIKEIIKDKAYFENSGGGLTISGGEPLTQIDFISAILKEAKKENIHTCIETSGHAKQNQVSKLINDVDLFLFDYKITGREKHKKYTGVYNDDILSNLDYLYQTKNNIVLRCPIIPGINDDNDHFQAISNLDKKYPRLQGIELMPYHDWGSHKYKQIGDKAYTITVDSVPSAQSEKWIQRFRSMGCTKVIIG